jgi:hypothetical protein
MKLHLFSPIQIQIRNLATQPPVPTIPRRHPMGGSSLHPCRSTPSKSYNHHTIYGPRHPLVAALSRRSGRSSVFVQIRGGAWRRALYVSDCQLLSTTGVLLPCAAPSDDLGRWETSINRSRFRFPLHAPSSNLLIIRVLRICGYLLELFNFYAQQI